MHVDTRRLLGSAKTRIADGCALQIALQGIAEDERNGHRLATQSRVRAEAAKSRANRWAEVCKRRNLVRGPMHFGGAFFYRLQRIIKKKKNNKKNGNYQIHP